MGGVVAVTAYIYRVEHRCCSADSSDRRRTKAYATRPIEDSRARRICFCGTVTANSSKYPELALKCIK